MKQTDLRPCSNCGNGVMHAGHALFYRMKIETMVVDIAAVQQQAGLEMMLGGNAALAFVMGPQRDMAKAAAALEVIVCMPCMMTVSMGELLALGAEDDDKTEKK